MKRNAFLDCCDSHSLVFNFTQLSWPAPEAEASSKSDRGSHFHAIKQAAANLL